eukprot:706361-Pelagomonas_calceolata.AAC.2
MDMLQGTSGGTSAWLAGWLLCVCIIQLGIIQLCINGQAAGEERWDICMTVLLAGWGDTVPDSFHGAFFNEHTAGEERWDIRMTGWLLYVLDKERQKSPGGSLNADGRSLWGQYLALLPPEHEMCCLLNYTQEDAKELQLQQLVVEAKVQREWSEYCHSYYFSKATGLYKFADSMEDSIWACAMVCTQHEGSKLGPVNGGRYRVDGGNGTCRCNKWGAAIALYPTVSRQHGGFDSGLFQGVHNAIELFDTIKVSATEFEDVK